MTAEPLDRGHARASGIAALLVALIGLAASAYLTIEHYRSATTLACPETGAINCAKVTTSAWSHFAGLPVADLGLAYYLTMVALVLPAAWRRPGLVRVRLAVAGIGVVMVLYLVWAELFRIDALCLYCTAVHICTVTIFALVLWQWTMTPARRLT